MAADLFFRNARDATQPVNLLFGEPVGGFTDANVTITGTLPAPSLAAQVGRITLVSVTGEMPAPSLAAYVETPTQVSVTGQMPAPTLAASVYYDNAVWRGLINQAGTDWQQGAKVQATTATTMQDGTKTFPQASSHWSEADRLAKSQTASHTEATRLREYRGTRWTEGLHRRNDSSARHTDGLRDRRPERTTRHTEALRLGGNLRTTPFQNMLRHARPRHVDPWQVAKHQGVDHSHDWQIAVRSGICIKGDYQEAMLPLPGLFTLTPPQPPEGPCYTPPPGSQVHLLFDELFTGTTHLLFRCPGVTPPPPDATIVVPIRKAYIVINDVHLRRVSGNIELKCYQLGMQIDADSWTWSFSATLHASDLANVEPAGYGEPVELDAEINGLHYRLVAEKIGRDRSFGNSAIKVSGRGKSSILSDPYSPLVTFTQESQRTAQQLMNDVLTTNGAPLGWSVEWNVTDWLVPAGAFAHQGSYMSAINAIAGSIGAYIMPHPTNNQLRVFNRYPTAPWNWGTVTPDIELPVDAVTKEGIAWEDRPNYNAVYVSGQSSGVLGFVKKTGTAGDVIAPMATDRLITHADAARQRGTAILGNTGRVAMVSLELPVLPETGIIEPGKFVRYVDGSTTRLGMVRGVTVNAKIPSIRQSIEVEVH